MDKKKFLIFYQILIFTLWIIPQITHAEIKTAYFAAGCFWCAEHDFEKIFGVKEVISGYMGGRLKNPNYYQVSAGGTGHYESIKVLYDSNKISYPELLKVFWHNIDPMDAGGQFCDRGDQYLSVIFFHNDEELKIIIESKKELFYNKKIKSIVTKILPVTTFYPAENYHQHYATKNPIRYRFYRFQCGRDQRLKEIWQ